MHQEKKKTLALAFSFDCIHKSTQPQAVL